MAHETGRLTQPQTRTGMHGRAPFLF